VRFAMKPVKWMADGRQHLASRFTDVQLPAGLAAFALRSGACVTVDDARRKQNHGAGVVGSPAAADCFDLDAAQPAAAAQPQPCREQSNQSDLRGRCMRCGAEQGEVCPQRVPHSAVEPNERLFTVVDRGGPFQMKVAR
jgi:hypothetical protein